MKLRTSILVKQNLFSCTIDTEEMANIPTKFLLFCLCILSTQTTKGVHGQCTPGSLQNQAVYEGTPNISMTCNSPTQVSWVCRPTTDEMYGYRITNYNDTVVPSYTNLFGVNAASLIIKSAQWAATTPPISTAGIYVVNLSNATKFGAKLVVVRQPPTCNCTANSTKVNITCSITYGDLYLNPINAKMTWTANGVFYTNDTPVRTRINPYYVSTSIITVDAYDPSNYQCTATFEKPTSITYAYVATNAPVFSATCTSPFCGNTTTAMPTSTTQPITTTLPMTTTTTDGTNLTVIYAECVVKAELYAKCDNYCPEDMVCGVVVTLRNDSRWLIHDPLCNDNKCEMVAVNASCMSSDWKLLAERKIAISGVGDYVQEGNGVQMGLNVTDCSESCKRMMNLP